LKNPIEAPISKPNAIFVMLDEGVHGNSGSGGSGDAELQRAVAYRVYEDPANLLALYPHHRLTIAHAQAIELFVLPLLPLLARFCWHTSWRMKSRMFSAAENRT
jgi:hypothetical protein